MPRFLRSCLPTLAGALFLSGTSCPIGGTSSTGYPRTAAWTRRTINTGANARPSVVATADLDHDGKLDVVAGYPGADSATAGVIIFFQESTDTFTAVIVANSADFTGLAALAVGDLDNDGNAEIIAAADGRLLFLHSPDAPRSAADWTFSTIDNSDDAGIGQWSDVVIGSIDGLNGPDLLACNEDADLVCWFKSPSASIADGTGWTRIAIDNATRINASSVALIDLDADSRLDAISTAPGESSATIAWYQNPTDPEADAWTKFSIGTFSAPSRLAVGDLDVDGRSDVVATNAPGRQVGWYQRPSDATTTWSGFLLTVYTSFTPVDVKIADINGDNQPNIVVATQTSGSVRWFMPNPGNTQTAQWLENNVIDLAETPGRIATGDIDADGRPDIIVPLLASSVDQDSIVWLENPE